jgi:hypothetical protein
MTNKEVYFEAKKQGIDRIEKMVEGGTMTREQGDEAINAIDQQMEFMNGPVGWVITIATTIIFGLIIIFIIVGIYYLFIKFLFKGEGSFTTALVATGLTTYISILQIIIAGILTMTLGKMIMDTSLASVMGSDKTTLTGWLLAKVDPISIWAYIILAVDLRKCSSLNQPNISPGIWFWLIGGFISSSLHRPFHSQAFIQ